MPDLMAIDGLSGCDTVAPYYGIGKGGALKVLRGHQHSLSCLSLPASHLDDVENILHGRGTRMAAVVKGQNINVRQTCFDFTPRKRTAKLLSSHSSIKLLRKPLTN